MDCVNTIISLLEPNLGVCKKSYSQVRFDCPQPGCDQGGKKNLEICVNSSSDKFLFFNCWACHYHGFATVLLRDYGANESWKHLKELQNDKKHSGTSAQTDKKILQLPGDCISFYKNKEVTEYLTDVRQLDFDLLYERQIKYVPETSTFLANHIIIPFYDINGQELKGFCAQNFSTKKYKNFGRFNYVPYINYININYPITLTEGAYDALSVINSIPLLGSDVSKVIAEFCRDKDVILGMDNTVSEYQKDEIAKKLIYNGVRTILDFSTEEYKDLNEFRIKNSDLLIDKYSSIFKQLYKI
jgi:hypothetical protein